MKGKKMGYEPIGKRTRLQRFLKEKEFSERNKKLRLEARSKHRMNFADKNNQDGSDDSNEDGVKVVDEAEYLRGMPFFGCMESSPNVDKENSDVSVQILGEIWNPVNVGIGVDDNDEDVDGAADSRKSLGMNSGFECGGHVSDGCKASPMEPGSFSADGTCSVTSSDNYDSELCTISTSEYSSSDDSEDGKRKVRSSNKEGIGKGKGKEVLGVNVSVVDHETADDQADGDENNELHSQGLLKSGEYGINSNNIESPKNNHVIFESESDNHLKPVNALKPKKVPPLQLKPDNDLKHGPENDLKCDNSGDRRRDVLTKYRNAGMESEFEHEKDLQPRPEKMPTPELKNHLEPDNDLKHGSENDRKCDDSSDRRRDMLTKYRNAGMGSKSEHEDLQPRPEKMPTPELKNHLEPDNDLKTDPENELKPKSTGDGKGGMLTRNRKTAIEKDSQRENLGEFDNISKRKRGWLPKKSDEIVNSTVQKKKRIRKLKTHEAENIMLNTILEKGNAGLNTCIHSATENKMSMTLPLKFRFKSENSVPTIPEEVDESEILFQELRFAVRACDIGAQTSFLDESDDANPGDNEVVQAQLCSEGKHYLIHDDEIGIRCKYCSFVKLEIRYVTPGFNKNPFGRAENKNRFPTDKSDASSGFHFPELEGDPQNTRLDNIQGTVWDLIPGIIKTLYPHQQEGFEFMWRNIGGGIKLEELGNPSKHGSGGCIICHAPGTGKTRLAITFLQSFIRQYPKSKPVIIAPKSMLLTWEEEFARWNIDVPFINMNRTELTGNEDFEVLGRAENVKHQRTIRVAKIYTWAMGKGILGISYTLFVKLAGDRKGVDKKIRKVLLEQPGILVMDEGHTARNDQSNIWNVLTEVETKRKIILSGTPFQNNFEELLNTISLVREEFGNPLLLGKYVKHGRNSTERRGLMDSNVENDRRISKLKNQMKPFVHIHKGEILKKTLRGLFHSVLLLQPSDLQKTCFQLLNGLKNNLKRDHLVSIASVHPSLLHPCEELPPSIKVVLKQHIKNLECGVKIRFLFDLINLAEGEKVLVFSQFLKPLKLIKKLLKYRYHWAEEKELIYMDGNQEVKQRQAFIRHFNNPKSEARVLLASTKACCEGIHLVGASRVVLLDVVWNPAVERQAISRAYRLGQQKDVFVYHLIISGTREEEKYYWQVTKDRVSEKVFSSQEDIKQTVEMMPRVSEDRILEEMIQNERVKNMFAKIIYQPKADELIESFGPMNL